MIRFAHRQLAALLTYYYLHDHMSDKDSNHKARIKITLRFDTTTHQYIDMGFDV